MTAIRNLCLQITYFQFIKNMTMISQVSNDRFGLIWELSGDVLA